MMDYRNQRRAYRRHMRRYWGGSGFIWPLAIILSFATHTWIWIPLAIFAPMILAAIWGSVNPGPQQPYQQQQPYYQAPYQPQEPVYQEPYQQPAEQPYQSYTQGYTPQAAAHPQPEVYQANTLPEQDEQQQVQQNQQYEDPLIMYPQE